MLNALNLMMPHNIDGSIKINKSKNKRQAKQTTTKDAAKSVYDSLKHFAGSASRLKIISHSGLTPSIVDKGANALQSIDALIKCKGTGVNYRKTVLALNGNPVNFDDITETARLILSEDDRKAMAINVKKGTKPEFERVALMFNTTADTVKNMYYKHRAKR